MLPSNIIANKGQPIDGFGLIITSAKLRQIHERAKLIFVCNQFDIRLVENRPTT